MTHLLHNNNKPLIIEVQFSKFCKLVFTFIVFVEYCMFDTYNNVNK